jgi:hypothetical protein
MQCILSSKTENAKGSKQMFQRAERVVGVQLGSIAVIAMTGLLFYTRGLG